MKPTVSVIMSVRNESVWLAEAILSIRRQTYRDFEFLIVDDASTDDTSHILQKSAAADPRIKVYYNEEPNGLARSLNRLISLAKGQYIARMDGDDISRDDRFVRQVDFLEGNPKIGLVGSYCREIDSQGLPVAIWKRPTESKLLRRALFKGNPFIHSSVMLRKRVFDEVGGYNCQCRYAQDYELWLRVAEKFEIGNLAEPLVDLRVDWEKLRCKNKLARKYQFKILSSHIRNSYLSSWHKLFLVRPLILFMIPTSLSLFLKKIQREFRKSG